MRIITVLAMTVLIALCLACGSGTKQSEAITAKKIYTEEELTKAVLYSKPIEDVKAILGTPDRATLENNSQWNSEVRRLSYNGIVKESHSGRIVGVDILFVDGMNGYTSWKIELHKYKHR